MGDTGRKLVQVSSGRSRGPSGEITLVGQDEVQALRLDRPWLTQEALDEARRTVSTWPCLGPSQWSAVADALGLRLRDDSQPLC